MKDEIGQMQDEIYHTIIRKIREVLPEFDESRIDGGFCDSGNPMDFSKAEVEMGMSVLIDEIEKLNWAKNDIKLQKQGLLRENKKLMDEIVTLRDENFRLVREFDILKKHFFNLSDRYDKLDEQLGE